MILDIKTQFFKIYFYHLLDILFLNSLTILHSNRGTIEK